MSRENVEWAKEAYDALSQAVRDREFDAWLNDYVHPEVEWVPMEGSPDGGAVLRGKEPIRARLYEMLETMEEPRLTAGEVIDAGETSVIAIHLSARGKGSGVDLEVNWFHVVAARDDKAVRIEWHATRSRALEAAGLGD